MKYLSILFLLVSFQSFSAEENEVSAQEKEVEAMLAELETNDYDDKEVVKSLNKPASRLPASVEE